MAAAVVFPVGAMTAVTLDEWASRIDLAAKERKGPGPDIRHELTHVDVTGNAAAVRLESCTAGASPRSPATCRCTA